MSYMRDSYYLITWIFEKVLTLPVYVYISRFKNRSRFFQMAIFDSRE